MPKTLKNRRCNTSTIAVLVLTTVLSGCLSKAPSHVRIVDQSLPKGTTIPPAWTSDAHAGSAVGNNWLQSFNDSQLNTLVDEAIAKNLDLAQAAAQVEVVRHSVAIVSSQLKPLYRAGALDSFELASIAR